MVKRVIKVIIETEAKKELRKAINYIRNDSIQNAEKVKKKLLDSIKNLVKNPEGHPPDKYRLDKDQCFRAYELYKYRISYHISSDNITVIRIKHTKMNPSEY